MFGTSTSEELSPLVAAAAAAEAAAAALSSMANLVCSISCICNLSGAAVDDDDAPPKGGQHTIYTCIVCLVKHGSCLLHDVL